MTRADLLATPAATRAPPARVKTEPAVRTRSADPHRDLGNLAVQRMAGALHRCAASTPAVAAADDPLEHEADRVAGEMMRTAAPGGSTAVGQPVSRRCAACVPNEIHRRPTAPVSQTAAPRSVDDALRTPGRPLDPATRAFFEPRFGRDFSAVRIHTDATAEASASDVVAHAYTVRDHVVFGAGKYAPASEAGQRLIAHELAHVVQQSSPPVPGAVARTPAEPTAASLALKTMSPRDASALLAQAGFDDPLNAITSTLESSSTPANWRRRLHVLTAAFSLLTEPDAVAVLTALTAPHGTAQKHLQTRFLRIDTDFRTPLLRVLRERTVAAPEPAPEHTSPPEPPPPARTAIWVELNPGVFAYVPDAGTTLDRVAAYLSGHPEVPAALVKLNAGMAPDKPMAVGTSVIVPIEFIDRPTAIMEMPEHIRRRVIEARQAQIDMERVRRLMTVRTGHPAGPGLIPVTGLAVRQGALLLGRTMSAIVDAVLGFLKRAVYVVAFMAGVVHGFLKSIWDAVAGIAKLIFDVLKSILTGNLLSDIADLGAAIRNMSWAKIKEAVQDWATEWAEKLDSSNVLTAGHAHGYLTGYVMAEAAMLLLTGGQIEEIKILVWGSDLGKLVKGSRAVRTLGAAVEKVNTARRAAGSTLGTAVEALRRSRFGKVVKGAEIAGAAVVWTVDKVMTVLRLPQTLAQAVAEKLVANAKRLGPFFERIGELSEGAQRWLFGCRSPCTWEPTAVEKTLSELDNTRIEARAAAEAAPDVPVTTKATVPEAKRPAPPPAETEKPKKRPPKRPVGGVPEDPQQGVRDALSRVRAKIARDASEITAESKAINDAARDVFEQRTKLEAANRGDPGRQQLLDDFRAKQAHLDELRERQAHRKAINEQDVATEKRLQSALDAKTYDRPAFRKGLREEVWENAKVPPDGKVFSPSGTEIPHVEGPWVMGHKPGYEFRKHVESSARRGISREQFIKECNEAHQYRPETDIDNSSHVYEDKTDKYLGH
jgi:hypothetical protein